VSRLLDISSNPQAFLARYSSILRNLIVDNGVVRDLAAATAFNIAQTLDLADEIKRSVGIAELVDRRRVYAVPLRLRESELVSDLNAFTYGSGAVYGDGKIFGGITTASASFGIPEGIASIGYIADSFIAETEVFIPGADFILRGNTLTLWRNPFETLSAQAKTVYAASGEAIDRELVLWAIDTEVWDRLAESMYGLIVGIADSGERGYAAVVGELWKAIVGGPSVAAVYNVLCAAAGVPLATATEVVRSIEATATGVVVVTDTTVYRGHATATPLVSVGDTVTSGSPVFDTVVIRDLVRTDSDLTGIPALTFHVDTAAGHVVVGFPNTEVAVRAVGSGYVFDIAGTDDDVTAFWAEVRRKEAAGAPTLESLLIAEFGAIPSTINPLRYLVSHLFLANAVVITIRPQGFLNDASLIAKASAVLAGLIPARILLIQHSYLDDQFDTMGCSTAGTGAAFFDGMAASDRCRVGGAAAPATELAYSDLQPMLANYAR
jgi:hypothetical protein